MRHIIALTVATAGCLAGLLSGHAEPTARTEFEQDQIPPPIIAHSFPPRKEDLSVSSNSCVAVLTTKKTALDALTDLADLKAKYPDVLGDSSFDVQEVDMTNRGLGTMYQGVAGPPGSHAATSELCARLKTAGYFGCWVKEY